MKENFVAVLTENEQMMPLEDFQNLLTWCGPLQELFTNIQYLISKPYFFGKKLSYFY